MSDDDANWRPRIPKNEEPKDRRPRPQPGPPPGEDYDTLFAKHGRPRGRFEDHTAPRRTK
jgi:hypothetical protein